MSSDIMEFEEVSIQNLDATSRILAKALEKILEVGLANIELNEFPDIQLARLQPQGVYSNEVSSWLIAVNIPERGASYIFSLEGKFVRAEPNVSLEKLNSIEKFLGRLKDLLTDADADSLLDVPMGTTSMLRQQFKVLQARAFGRFAIDPLSSEE